MALVINMPTPEGRALGTQLARMADKEELSRPLVRKRCETCAFRNGTHPNGCVPTVLDALKCTMEHVPFKCHESDPCGDGATCAGYELMKMTKKVQAPWKFSDEYTDNSQSK